MQPRNKTHARLLKKLAAKKTNPNSATMSLNNVSLQDQNCNCWALNDNTNPGYGPGRNDLLNEIKNQNNLTQVASCAVSGTPAWSGRCFDITLFRGINNSANATTVTEPMITNKITDYCNDIFRVERDVRWVIYGSLSGALVLLACLGSCFASCCRRRDSQEDNSTQYQRMKN